MGVGGVGVRMEVGVAVGTVVGIAVEVAVGVAVGAVVGVDVGAKSEIYRMMEDLAREGKIIIMISSDNPELIAISDRVGVMRDKRLVTVLEGDRITEENILRYSMGVDEKG